MLQSGSPIYVLLMYKFIFKRETRNVQSDIEDLLEDLPQYSSCQSCPCLASFERLLSSLTLRPRCVPGTTHTHNMLTAFQKGSFSSNSRPASVFAVLSHYHRDHLKHLKCNLEDTNPTPASQS